MNRQVKCLCAFVLLAIDVRSMIVILFIQNPYTFGYPNHGLAENGFVNITSRVPTLEFYDADGTPITISNLASADVSRG